MLPLPLEQINLHLLVSGDSRPRPCLLVFHPHSLLTPSSLPRVHSFGFVTYEDTQMVDVVMSRKDHSIKGKEVEIKRAFPRGDSRNGPPGGGRGGPMVCCPPLLMCMHTHFGQTS